MSPSVRKCTFERTFLEKSQIKLCIRAVWSNSSLTLNPWLSSERPVKTDQTARKHRQILVFVVRKDITKTRLFKYIEHFTTKNWEFSDKISDIFHISAQNIDCGYSLKLYRYVLVMEGTFSHVLIRRLIIVAYSRVNVKEPRTCYTHAKDV